MKNSTKMQWAAVAVIVVALGSWLIFSSGIAGKLLGGPKTTVDKALTVIKTQKDNGEILFQTDYLVNLLSKNSYYKIDEWEIGEVVSTDTTAVVEVKGTAANAFGAKLDRSPIFVLEKSDGKWIIRDSYNFIVFERAPEMPEKSDMQKLSLLNDVKEKVRIEKWNWKQSDYGDSVEGDGLIVNESELPVEFVKLVINYYNTNGDQINSDESYALSQELIPGQRRKFTWYTADCGNCKSARISLKFD